jgi:microcystin-dependent protein
VRAIDGLDAGSQRVTNVASATAGTDAVNLNGLNAYRPVDPAAVPCLAYRGAWVNTATYYAGDLVMGKDGRLYTAAVDQPPANGTTVVGTASATNAAAKTTTTVITLPAGCVAGDSVMLALALHSLNAGVLTTDLIKPTWATQASVGAATSGTASSSGAHGLYSYRLTTADITAGTLTVPIQSTAANAAGTSLDAAIVVIRGGNTTYNASVTAASATATSATAASASPLLGSPSLSHGGITRTVWAGGAHFSANRSSGLTGSPTALGSSIIGQPAAGNGGGALALGTATGEVDTAETLSLALSASQLWSMKSSAVQFGYTDRLGTLPALWTPVDTEPAGTIKMWAGQWTGVPSGWLLCDGTSYALTDYPDLATAISPTYGGDGTSVFNVPDFTNRFPRGNTYATSGGSDTHTHADTLTAPAHTHSVGAHTHDMADTVGFAEIDVASGGVIFVRRQAPSFTYTQTASATGVGASSGTANSSAGLTGRTSSMTAAANTGGASATALTGGVTSITTPPVAWVGVAFIIKT